MAHQAISSFYVANEDGSGETFVPKGKVFSSTHRFVKMDATGTLFEKVDVDDDPKPDGAKK